MLPQNTFFSIDVTNDCNLNCIHCRNSLNKESMDFKKIKIISEKIKTISPRGVIISGGEPLIRDDIIDIVRLFHDNNMLVQLNTNGTLLDKMLLKKLVNAGVNYIQLSIDGPREIHNHIRGSDIYDKVINSGKLICDYSDSVKLNINCTVSLFNMEYVEELLIDILFNQNIDADFFGLKRYIPFNYLKDEYKLGKNGLKDFLNLYDYLRKKYSNYIEIRTDTPQRNLLDINKVNKLSLKHKMSCVGCSAFIQGPTIHPNGDLTPCPTLPVVIGNIFNEDILKIYNDIKFDDFEDRKGLKGKCGICDNKLICGGCRAAAYAETGDYLEEDPECFYE